MIAIWKPRLTSCLNLSRPVWLLIRGPCAVDGMLKSKSYLVRSCLVFSRLDVWPPVSSWLVLCGPVSTCVILSGHWPSCLVAVSHLVSSLFRPVSPCLALCRPVTSCVGLPSCVVLCRSVTSRVILSRLVLSCHVLCHLVTPCKPHLLSFCQLWNFKGNACLKRSAYCKCNA